jgi:flagellar biosynthesis/type III secretory pathway protein FliH
MTRKKPVKTSIPWELHMAIIKLQASEEINYEEACLFASKLLEPNSEAYQDEVKKEILKHDRSQLMTSINKGKKSWIDKGRQQGLEEGFKQGFEKGVSEYKITYSCSVCDGELFMKPGANDHIEMKKLMKQAGWAHTTCLNKK